MRQVGGAIHACSCPVLALMACCLRSLRLMGAEWAVCALRTGHECDTDLCVGCAKSILPGAGQPGGGAPGAMTCCNMRLRFRQHKRVAMGKSDIAGWGSFLMVGCSRWLMLIL